MELEVSHEQLVALIGAKPGRDGGWAYVPPASGVINRLPLRLGEADLGEWQVMGFSAVRQSFDRTTYRVSLERVKN